MGDRPRLSRDASPALEEEDIGLLVVLTLKQEPANCFGEWNLLFAGNSAILVQKLPHLHQFHLHQRVAKHLGGGEMQKLCISQQ